jgi:N-acetylmuramoyl-L-alanine amidase
MGRVTVKDIRYLSQSGHTRVVIDLSGPAEYVGKRIGKPDRFYMDLKGSTLAGKAVRAGKHISVGDGLLINIRASQFSADTVRVVFDLDRISNYKVFSLEDPSRVVIDVYGASGNEWTGEGEVYARKQRPLRPDVRRVVIDAGHGGRDPGAVGLSGIKEKDLALDLAVRIRKILQKQGGYEVFLTRNSDISLKLERRTVIANTKDADLFISIHANANRDRRVRGVETYLLNWTNDKAAMKVAARENRIYLKRKKENRSDLGVILASLELQNKRDESLVLAHYVQDSMVSSLKRRYRRVQDLGVKQALFYVLLGAKMPSVLVEVAFITNKEEARRLKSSAYRQRLAEGVAKGVKTYFIKSEPVQKIAKR